MSRRPWFSYPFGQRPTDDIWQCPLAQVLPDAAYGGYMPSLVGYHSYVMNIYLDYDSPYSLPVGYNAYPSFLNLAKAQQSSVTLLMFETTLMPAAGYGQTGIGTTSCTAGQPSHDSPRSLSDRHPHMRGKLGGNLLMLDGHVEWTDHLWDTSLSTPDLPPQTNRTWWPY